MIELIFVILIVALASVPIIDLILITLVVMLAIVAMRQRKPLGDLERFDADYRAKLPRIDVKSPPSVRGGSYERLGRIVT
jgi:hypothetical protein